MTDRKEVELLADTLTKIVIKVRRNHATDGHLDGVTVTIDEQERTMDPLTFAERFRPVCAVRLVLSA